MKIKDNQINLIQYTDLVLLDQTRKTSVRSRFHRTKLSIQITQAYKRQHFVDTREETRKDLAMWFGEQFDKNIIDILTKGD